MLTTVPIEGKGVGDAYGLGIYETKLPNGVSVWGMEEEFLDLQLLLGVIGGKHIHWLSVSTL